MAYSRQLAERFALEADKVTQQTSTFGATVHIPSIAKTLCISEQDAQAVALYLRELKWVSMEHATQNSCTITPFGYEEIAKVKRPPWRKWVARHSVILAFFGGIALNLAIDAFKHFVGWK